MILNWLRKASARRQQAAFWEGYSFSAGKLLSSDETFAELRALEKANFRGKDPFDAGMHQAAMDYFNKFIPTQKGEPK